MVIISKNPKFKLFIGLLMTCVLVVSLFAGIGVIWVNEDTHVASAETDMLNDDGSYRDIPGTSGSILDNSRNKGSATDPFTVLEIVPNHSMAQFGYLVKGQEPIDFSALADSDDEYKELYYNELEKYLVPVPANEDEVVRVFDEYLNEDNKFKAKPDDTEETVDFEAKDYLWESSYGKTTQYGEYRLVDEGDFVLYETHNTELKGFYLDRYPEGAAHASTYSVYDHDLPEGTYIYLTLGVNDPSIVETAVEDSILSETTDGKLATMFVPKDKLPEDRQDKDDRAEYSNEWYKYVGNYKGDYSTEYEYRPGKDGDTQKIDISYYETSNSVNMGGTQSFSAVSGDKFVVFRPATSADSGKMTYDLKGGAFTNSASGSYNKYYQLIPTTNTAFASINITKLLFEYYPGKINKSDGHNINTSNIVLGTSGLTETTTIKCVSTTDGAENGYKNAGGESWDGEDDTDSFIVWWGEKYDYKVDASHNAIYEHRVYKSTGLSREQHSYKKYYYVNNSNNATVTHYYFGYDGTSSADDTSHVHAVFTKNNSDNGLYVVDDRYTKNIGSSGEYGMAYTFHYDWKWLTEAGSKRYDYQKKNWDDNIPRYVGANSGAYEKHDFTQVVAGKNIPQKTPSAPGNDIYPNNYVRYEVIPVFSEDYTYSFKKTTTEALTGDIRVIGKYKWFGNKYVGKPDNADDYKLPDFLNNNTATYAYNKRLFPPDGSNKPTEVVSAYPEKVENVDYGRVFKGSFESKDLFKKNSIGLAYKYNSAKGYYDYALAKDIDSFSFLGWYSDPQGVNRVSDELKIVSNTTLYAKWLTKYPDDTTSLWEGYTVTFDANVKETDTDKVVEASMPGDAAKHQITGFSRGAKLSAPDKQPIRSNHLFMGWYLDAECKHEFVFGSTALDDSIVTDNNVTLYARWSNKFEKKPDNTYSFEFNPNISQILINGIEFRTFDNQVYTGQKITGVADNGRRYYTKTSLVDGNPVETDILFEEIALESYTPVCKFIADDKKDTPTGYVFAGWYMDSDCTEAFDFSPKSIARIKQKHPEIINNTELTVKTFPLYARWINEKEVNNFVVTLDVNRPSGVTWNAGITDKSEGHVWNITNVNKPTQVVAWNQEVRELTNIKPSLTGTVEERLNSFNVKVVTATPEDLKTNLQLISRADLIVINETCSTTISDIWKKFSSYKKNGLLSEKYTGTDNVYTSFTQNDLSWDAVGKILQRIAGMDSTGDICPVLFDYNIIFNCIDPTASGAEWENNYRKYLSYNVKSEETEKAEDEFITVERRKACSLNVYKLYLMTQVSSPVTMYNAFFTDKLGKKLSTGTDAGGRTTGKHTFNGTITTGDPTVYWNEYTLIPYNLITKDEWDSNAQRELKLKLFGFGINGVLLPSGKESLIKNRLFIYNSGALSADDINIISSFPAGTILRDSCFAEVKELLGTPRNTNFEVGDIFYFMLHDRKQYANFNRDLKVLEIQPFTFHHSDEYWFWYISHYAPNVTGDITGKSMSAWEFQNNVDDITGKYDVIYMGTDVRTFNLEGKVDNSNNEGFIPQQLLYKYLDKEYEGSIAAIKSQIENSLNDGSSFRTDPKSALAVTYTGTIEGVSYTFTRDGDIEFCDKEDYDTANDLGNGCTRVNTGKKGGTDYGIFELLREYGVSAFADIRRIFGAQVADNGTLWKQAADDYSYKFGDDGYIYIRRCIDFGGKHLKKTPNALSKYLTIPAEYVGAMIDIATDHIWPPFAFLNEDLYPSYVDWVESNHPDLFVEQDPLYEYSRIGYSYEVEKTKARPYAYFHTGNSAEISKLEMGSFNTNGTSDNIKASVYSGNDFSYANYKAVAEFLKAGYPIVFDEGFFDSEGNIDTSLVDTGTWVYKLAMELKGDASRTHYNWFRENETEDTIAAKFLTALQNKTFTIKKVSMPAEYPSYINGTEETKSNRTLEFKVKIDEIKGSGTYKFALLIDSNGDGKYTDATETVGNLKVYIGTDIVSNGRLKARSGNSTVTYRITSEMPEDQTLIPWKLRLIKMGAGESETTIRDEITGLSAIKVNSNQRRKLFIAQVVSDKLADNCGGTPRDLKDIYGNTLVTGVIPGQTTLYLPTDDERQKAQYKNGSIKNWFAGHDSKNAADYFKSDSGYIGNYNADNAKNKLLNANAAQMARYLNDLDEYEVHIVRITTSRLGEIAEALKTDSNALIAKNAADRSGKVNLSVKYNNDSGFMYESDSLQDISWSQINMLVLGFGYGYNDIENSDSLQTIQDFIEAGKPVLFTNDTIRAEFLNKSAYQSAVGSSKDYYTGYNLTKTFRTLFGLDRYGAFSNRGVWDDVKAGVPDLKSIGIESAYQHSLDYDIPFAFKKSIDITSIGNVDIISNSDKRVLIQGLTNTAMWPAANNAVSAVYKATKTNEGQITSYPYAIGRLTADKNYTVMDIGLACPQSLQLNTEDEDVVVWFTLYREGIGRDDRDATKNEKDPTVNIINNGANNYYIFSKGNLTYTGMGFNPGLKVDSTGGTMTIDEYQLLVNTLVASYRVAEKPTKPVVKNPEKSSDESNNKDYLYIDYEATVKFEDSQPLGDNEDVVPYRADGTIIESSSSDVPAYYAKRVFFEIDDNSLMIDKKMTVHYYPAVIDKSTGVRVVLYDYPLDLKTYRVDYDDYTTAGTEISTIASNNVGVNNLKYYAPAEMNLTDAQILLNNTAIVHVSNSWPMVKNYSDEGDRYMYYVDVPLTQNYYMNLTRDEHNSVRMDEYGEIKYNTGKLGEINNGTSLAGKYEYEHGIALPGAVAIDKSEIVNGLPDKRIVFGLEHNDRFEIEIQVLMQYGKDPTHNPRTVGTRGVVLVRRGMFTLD